MATKLSVFNGAMRLLGERKLLTLTDDRKPRRVLDGIWDDGFVRYVLQQGQWKFAKRTIQANYDPAIEPDFGYQYAIEKPSDWLRTVAIATDEYFRAPLLRYSDEKGYWFCDYTTIYAQIISDDEEYGGNLSLWPETFTQWAESYMAVRAEPGISGNETKLASLKRESKQLLTDARSKDAMDGAPGFAPAGSWVRSRMGRSRHPNIVVVDD